jgi:hypothetical protein
MVKAICHPDKPPRVWMMLSTKGFSTNEAKLASATGEANAVALLRSWMVAISRGCSQSLRTRRERLKLRDCRVYMYGDKKRRGGKRGEKK